jgi:hypothetical protein
MAEQTDTGTVKRPGNPRQEKRERREPKRKGKGKRKERG